MKKLIALLLAAVMMLSLTACGGPDILGTYETTIDLTDYVIESYDKGTGMTDTDLSLANYMDEFKLTVTFEFSEDGTYRANIKESSYEEAMSNLKSAVLVMMDDFLLQTFKDMFRLYGYTVTTKEEVEELAKLSWDQIYTNTLGMSAEEFISQIIDEGLSNLIRDVFSLEGNYVAEDGKLYTSTSLNEECYDDTYETYEIEGDVITVTGGVNVEENEYLTYPFTLTKVA